MASNMKTKFQKYWDCYSVILSFAIILDPRYKLQFVEYCFFVLDPQSRDEKVLSIKQKLFRLFEEYSKTNTGITAAPMESTFNGDNGQTRDLMDGFDVYQSQQEASGNKSELELYLEERLVDRKQQPDLNVLTYWKESRIRYPELSLMARDILSIPITTVASESAFSHGGRILGKFRTSMLPDNVEALLCSRDWLYNSEECLDKDFEVEQEDEEQDLGIDISRLSAEQDASSNVDT
ncbi:zinc finger BED domain-containing protein DAYSLEEPER-like isoform X2 [Coffea eugenioides]|uniref:zinc finger BED domain-containing protein DAYSLEEPER-like isoform X1 n=1 Tax=Coffea eugenioides TaxID=49369 RepID=UPI000F6127B3|nr:zinc finger BED domain-containing protein DAYSLEEPER-like isoform X1 [Coffea eugenioides]XP_027156230.1 zinc finger BED domain-containing protein DAYSLEEPER-like isoform X2 [Coffea eugenioides]XP_027169970.1 zinc finger BED domain-containing protein DAYSLEEPER-like isoform X1 [Coffea eugenioides]XP_027169971.1 zinc finger BED domain-containing protein DAYSLEEPER-like isoform X2 [Coffea eugenioides]XP_027173046.1 zinc finger BED domain-containing protein DAYSLEEPER-like isoform X1 [Coffea eug